MCGVVQMLFPMQCMICDSPILRHEKFLNVYADERLGAVHERCWEVALHISGKFPTRVSEEGMYDRTGS